MDFSEQNRKEQPWRRDTRPVIKPVGHYPNPPRGRPSHRNPVDVTGVGPEDMRPIHPDSVYIPPA